MEKYFKRFKSYFLSLNKYIILSFLIFSFAVFYGYFSAQSSPEEMNNILEEFVKIYEPVFKMGSFGQFLFILLNNGLTLFFIILLGFIFGIPSFFALFSNGLILGIVAFFSNQAFSWSTFFLGVLPHGILEIPVLILGCAMGLKIGKISFDKIFKKQGDFKEELSLALYFYLKIIFPLLVLAAAIEIFISAKLLNL